MNQGNKIFPLLKEVHILNMYCDYNTAACACPLFMVHFSLLSKKNVKTC